MDRLKENRGWKKTVIATILVSAAFLASGVLTLYVVRGMETATSEFTGLGAAALPAIVVYAAFNTAFPEELLFRGFLLKRLSNKFGFHVANFIQAFFIWAAARCDVFYTCGSCESCFNHCVYRCHCMVYGVCQWKMRQRLHYSKLDYTFRFQSVFRDLCRIPHHIGRYEKNIEIHVSVESNLRGWKKRC